MPVERVVVQQAFPILVDCFKAVENHLCGYLIRD